MTVWDVADLLIPDEVDEVCDAITFQRDNRALQGKNLAFIIAMYAPPRGRYWRQRKQLTDCVCSFAPLLREADAIVFTERYSNDVQEPEDDFVAVWRTEDMPLKSIYFYGDFAQFARLLRVPLLIFDHNVESAERILAQSVLHFAVIVRLAAWRRVPPGYFWSDDPYSWGSIFHWFVEKIRSSPA